MARFRIMAARKSSPSGDAEFEVEWLVGRLLVGDSFRVYDTHHPVVCVIKAIRGDYKLATLTSAVHLGWDNQFAPAIVDTEAGRPDDFKYQV